MQVEARGIWEGEGGCIPRIAMWSAEHGSTCSLFAHLIDVTINCFGNLAALHDTGL